MKIDRRNLLWATAGLAMTKLVGPASSQASLAVSDEFPWHPITRSLLDRARQASLGSWIADLVRSTEHDNALMAPKLHSKARVMAENVSAEAVVKVRAVAAQIGWLETCIPLVAAQAVTEVELFLSAGVSPQPFLRCWF